VNYMTLCARRHALGAARDRRIRCLAVGWGDRRASMYWTSVVGLNQRTMRGCSSAEGLRDLGNTVIVVEHDEDAIRNG